MLKEVKQERICYVFQTLLFISLNFCVKFSFITFSDIINSRHLGIIGVEDCRKEQQYKTKTYVQHLVFEL